MRVPYAICLSLTIKTLYALMDQSSSLNLDYPSRIFIQGVKSTFMEGVALKKFPSKHLLENSKLKMQEKLGK